MSSSSPSQIKFHGRNLVRRSPNPVQIPTTWASKIQRIWRVKTHLNPAAEPFRPVSTSAVQVFSPPSSTIAPPPASSPPSPTLASHPASSHLVPSSQAAMQCHVSGTVSKSQNPNGSGSMNSGPIGPPSLGCGLKPTNLGSPLNLGSPSVGRGRASSLFGPNVSPSFCTAVSALDNVANSN